MSDELSELVESIERLQPIDEREASSRTLMLSDLRSPFPSWGAPGDRHFTASAVVVSSEGTLLHFHRRLHLWLQPGGHIEAGETPWAAAVREVIEETGLAPLGGEAVPQLLHVDVHEAGAHTHLDLRYLLRANGQPAPPPGESQIVRWFSWQEAERVAGPGLIGALRAARLREGG